MKRFFILMLAIACIITVKADEYNNQLSVSAGYMSAPVYFTTHLLNGILQSSAVGDMAQLENLRNYGAYNLSYHYATARWFQIGVKLNYEFTGFDLYCNSNDPQIVAALGSDHTLLGKSDTRFLMAMLSMQFTYLNKPVVKLYSGIDLGGGMALWQRSEMFDQTINPIAVAADKRLADIQEYQEKYPNGKEIHGIPAFNVTVLGLNVGTRVYGLAELNVGFDSSAKIGLGVRF